MLKRILLISAVISLAIAANGCEEEVRTPQIVGNASHAFIEPTPPVYTPTPRPAKQDTFYNVPAAWIPPRTREKRWKAIVIHHSGTRSGNAAIFDDWHKNERHWQGVGYDFVIGNGNKSPDGKVEVTFRWREQIAGAHVGGTPENWANVDAVGICIVGDFNKTRPTSRQMASLRKLIRFLQKRYNIPAGRIYGHKNTPGYTGVTQCPGRNFSVYTLKRSL